MREFLANFQGMPLFKITNLRNLRSAKVFHREIVNNLQTAKSVFIITLYFGNEQKTREVMAGIKTRRQKNMETKVIIDYNRCKQNEKIFALLKEYQIEDVVYYANRRSYSLLPNCIKELFSVLHVKVYIFDDLIILSGANLEDKYFTNRLDRYFSIYDAKLADYLIKNVFEHFYRSKHVEGVKGRPKSDIDRHYMISESNVARLVESLRLSNTYVVPYSESEELSVIENIFVHDFVEYYISTAYINFPEIYLKHIKTKDATIISPDASCNTFCGSSLLDKLVCKLYDYYMINTENILDKADLRTFYRRKASFHFKGIWAFAEDFAITVIGSSNFNERSYRKDKELNFVLITGDEQLIKQFEQEIRYLEKHSEKVNGDNKVNVFIKMIAYVMKYFL